MRLNWGPYLWMRCFNNGAQFLDGIVGKRPDWDALESAARSTPAGCGGVAVLPFASPEPSLNVTGQRVEWTREPGEPGARFRASLEALAFLIKRGVREHVQSGQKVERISVSGGIARSDLMCEILASVLERELHRLVSFEGPALGAAVTALAALETYKRNLAGVKEPFRVADAVARMVKFRDVVRPRDEWREEYRRGFAAFEARLSSGGRD
jgi:sugar (pentulose or hexulose) kinase